MLKYLCILFFLLNINIQEGHTVKQSDNIVRSFLAQANTIEHRAKYGLYVDWSARSSEKRLYVINIKKQEVVYTWWTSHGSGSGDKFAKNLSNVPNSLKSVEGRLITGETYIGKHGYSLKLHGLDKGTNDNVEKRAIVIHPAPYVTEDYVKSHDGAGRSHGCITLNPKDSRRIIDMLKGGSPVILGH